MNALKLAILFHETYERLAPSFGYETRDDTKKFDETSKNGRLMVAVCDEILSVLEAAQHDTNEKLAKVISDMFEAVSPPQVVHIGETCNRYEATYSANQNDPFKRGAAALAEAKLQPALFQTDTPKEQAEQDKMW